MATVAELVAKIGADTSELQRELKKVGGQFSDFEQKGTRASSKVTNSMKALGTAIAALGIAAMVREIIRASLSFEQMNTRLLSASGSSKVAQDSFTFLSQETERLGLDFISTANAFASFEAAALRAGVTYGEVKDTFVAVAEASTAMKLSAEDTNLVFVALSQIASKGVVSMEEFRQQLGERLPFATAAAADGLGVTQAELIDLISTGNLAARDFFPAFAKGLKEQVGDAAVEASQSATANLNRLNNALFDLKVQAADGKAMMQFNDILRDLTEILQDPQIDEGLATLIEGLGKITQLAIAAGAGIGNFISLVDDSVEGVSDSIMGALFGAEGVEALQSAREQRAQGLADEVVETTKLAQEKAKEALSGMGMGGLDDYMLGGSTQESADLGDIGADGEKYENELQKLEEYFLSKEELELEHHERRIEQLQEYLENEKNLTADQRADLEKLEERHAQVMVAKKKEQEKKKQREQLQSFSDQISAASNANKVFFQLNKARAIAEALIKGRQAVVDSYQFGASIGGPPLGAAMAGVAAAATASQIAQIASTSYGSTGGGVSSGGGGSGAVANTTQTDQFGRPQETGGQSRSLTIDVRGLSDDELFNGRQVRQIIESLNEATSDGSRLRVR